MTEQTAPSGLREYDLLAHDMHRHFWPGSVAEQHSDGGDCYKCRRMGNWLRAALAAGVQEKVRASGVQESASCGNDEWDSRYACIKPKGHPIKGPGLTDHDYRLKSLAVPAASDEPIGYHADPKHLRTQCVVCTPSLASDGLPSVEALARALWVTAGSPSPDWDANMDDHYRPHAVAILDVLREEGA